MEREKWQWCRAITFVAGLILYLSSLGNPVWAFDNNGFETDWIYALRTSTSELKAYRESDGALMGTLIPPFPGYPSPNHISDTCYDAWVSLTFSGTLANNDARLYAAGEIPRQDGDCGGSQHPDDIVIIEVGPEGCSFDGSDARKRVYLKDLLGVTQVGSHVRLGTFRFSHFHNTLFISIDKDYTNRLSLVYIYEIDLELTTILNTYTGASVHRHEPMMDIDPTNGKIYATESRMGEPYSEDNYGDLIEIDTTGGSTGVFTTLIDGPTYNATDSRWSGPRCPVYRGYNNPDGRPTFILPFNLSSDCVTLEFYLDANDGNYPPAGNLICRGEPYVRPTTKAAWRGRLDQITGTVMIPRLFDGTAGIDLVEPDDSTRRIVAAYGFQDVASPGIKTQTSPPVPAGNPQIDPTDPYQFLLDGSQWYPAGYYPALGAITLRWNGDPLVDYYEALLDTLSANGINYTRLVFTMGVAPDWGTCVQSCPYVVVGTVDKSGDIFGKVDLDQFNQAHFDLWRDLVQYAQSKGIVIQLCILDSWHTLANEPPWWHFNHDFYASGMNVNGLAAASIDAWHTTNPADAVWQRHAGMIEEVVDQLGDLPNIVWEIANEARFYYDNNNYGDIITKETAPITDWALQLGNHLKSYELSTRGSNHVCMPVDLHGHQKTPGQRNKWRVGYTDCMTPSGAHRDYLYIHSLTDGGDPRFPARPMFTDNDGGGVQEINLRRQMAWTCLTSRGHFDYFHFAIREHSDLTSQDATDGMRYLGYTTKFINDLAVNLQGMVPRDDLVTSGWCLARSGQEYVIYLISGGSTTVSNLPGSYVATWFNPRDSITQSAGTGPTFNAPDSNDWVLHISSGFVAPTGTVIEDTFANASPDRDPGDPLVGTAPEYIAPALGSLTWDGLTSAIFTSDGSITNQDLTTPRASVPLGPAWSGVQPIALQARLNVGPNPPGDHDWVSLGFMSGTSTVFADGEVWMLIRRDGRYTIFANGTANSLAQDQITVYNQDLYKQTSIQYNPTNNTVSAWINCIQVLADYDLDGIYDPSITHVGVTCFRSGEHLPADSLQVDNFKVVFGDYTPDTVPSDFDNDCDVDHEDFGFFQRCYSGLLPYPEGCDDADLNGSGYINLDDFDIFYPCMTGANQPPDC
ncbi:MAG: hypothetical protein ACYTF1_01460 [Planctomycetota bacterium]